MTGLSRGNERKVGGGASERSEKRERARDCSANFLDPCVSWQS